MTHRKLIEQIDAAMVATRNIHPPITRSQCQTIILAAREYLAAPEQSEPVAWIEHDWSGSGVKRLRFSRRAGTVRDEVVNPVWTPLYTHAAPQPKAPQPTELTDEQLVNAMCADGCERIESFYLVGPVQKAAVWSFAKAVLAAARKAP